MIWLMVASLAWAEPAPDAALPMPALTLRWNETPTRLTAVRPPHDDPKRRRTRAAVWVTSGLTAAVGGTLAAVAASENRAMRQAEDAGQVESAFARQRATGAVAYTLLGASVVTFSVGWAL
jgi:hypothetical protein